MDPKASKPRASKARASQAGAMQGQGSKVRERGKGEQNEVGQQ